MSKQHLDLLSRTACRHTGIGFGDVARPVPGVLMDGTQDLSGRLLRAAPLFELAPIAVAAAEGLGVSPYPLLMTVAIAASTAFATPVASPVNTLILGPGGYRFNDFVKVGVPLQLLAMGATLLTVPLVFPL